MDLNADDFNKWLLIPGGGSLLGLIVWKVLSRARLDVSRDSADRENYEAQARAGLQWRQQRDDAEARATAHYELYIREQRRANGLDQRVSSLERESADLKGHLRDLATMLIEIAPESTVFVQRWLHSSGLDASG